MSKKISNKTKIAQGLGTGEGADYKPFITVRELSSSGTTSVIKDWKTGRSVHCMSQAEAAWYYILRWNDENVDIREQYPLKNELTVIIADSYGFKHPFSRTHIMTTDFLVTESDGSLHAYSVKPDKDVPRRVKETIAIEKTYWEQFQEPSVPFDMLFKADINPVLVTNIRLATEFYDENLVFDEYSMIKHKIAAKEWEADLESEILTTDVMEKIRRQNHG